jgi:hypothetical protein
MVHDCELRVASARCTSTTPLPQTNAISDYQFQLHLSDALQQHCYVAQTGIQGALGGCTCPVHFNYIARQATACCYLTVSRCICSMHLNGIAAVYQSKTTAASRCICPMHFNNIATLLLCRAWTTIWQLHLSSALQPQTVAAKA